MLIHPVLTTKADGIPAAALCCCVVSLFALLPLSYILTEFAPEEYAFQNHYNQSMNAWTAVFRDDGMALDSLNQFFTLDMVPHYSHSEHEEIDRSFFFDIALRGRDSDEEEWTVITSARRHRRLFCKIGHAKCYGIALLHQIYLPYSFYRVDFRVPHQDIPFVPAADFSFHFVRTHFSFYELALRYALVCLALWRLCVLHAACTRATGGHFPPLDSALMAEQRLAYCLLLALIFQNDPLFLVTVSASGWVPHLLRAVFSISFVAVFSLATLVITDLTALPVAARTDLSLRYLAPKLAVVGGLWIAVAYGYLNTRAMQGADASYDIADNDLQTYELLTFIVYACFLTLFFWLVYLLLRRTGQLQEADGDIVVAPPSLDDVRSGDAFSADRHNVSRSNREFRGVVGDDSPSPKRFYFFVIMTLSYLVALALAWIISVVSGPQRLPIGHLHVNCGEITATLFLTNFYVAAVAWAFSPAGDMGGYRAAADEEYFGAAYTGTSVFDD